MRFLLIILFLIVTCLAKAQTIDHSKIRFDGFYKTKAEIDKRDKDTTYEYLRFYPTGTVITIASDGTPDDLKPWFNLGHDNTSVGNYKIQDKKLYFSTIEKQGGGTIIYHGTIKNPYYIVLRSKSLMTGYRDREKFFFVAVPDLH